MQLEEIWERSRQLKLLFTVGFLPVDEEDEERRGDIVSLIIGLSCGYFACGVHGKWQRRRPS